MITNDPLVAELCTQVALDLLQPHGRKPTCAGAFEIQATGEKRGFSRDEFEQLFALAGDGIADLVKLQDAAVGG
jgi:hypothetical protein